MSAMWHPEEGALLRLLDDEADDIEAARLERHLSACAECARAAEVLRGARGRLYAALADLDSAEAPGAEAAGSQTPLFPSASARPRGPAAAPPLRRVLRERPRVGAAASLILAVALLGLVPPLRAWVVHGWVLVAGAVATDAVSEPRQAPLKAPPAPVSAEERESGSLAPPPPPLEEPDAPLFILAFLPLSETFVVEVERRQPGAILELWLEGRSASVEAWAAGELQRVDVRPGHLRIRNAGETGRKYRVVLPGHLREVSVRVEGVEVARLGRAGFGRHTFHLSPLR